MVLRDTLIRCLLNVLRSVVGSFAGLIALASMVIVYQKFSVNSVGDWLDMVGVFFCIVISGLAGSLAYGLFFMRYWVRYVIRLALFGLIAVLGFLYMVGDGDVRQTLVTSPIGLFGCWVILLLGLLDVLVHKNRRYLTRE